MSWGINTLLRKTDDEVWEPPNGETSTPDQDAEWRRRMADETPQINQFDMLEVDKEIKEWTARVFSIRGQKAAQREVLKELDRDEADALENLKRWQDQWGAYTAARDQVNKLPPALPEGDQG